MKLVLKSKKASAIFGALLILTVLSVVSLFQNAYNLSQIANIRPNQTALCIIGNITNSIVDEKYAVGNNCSPSNNSQTVNAKVVNIETHGGTINNISMTNVGAFINQVQGYNCQNIAIFYNLSDITQKASVNCVATNNQTNTQNLNLSLLGTVGFSISSELSFIFSFKVVLRKKDSQD
jgi:hypothetical protein